MNEKQLQKEENIMLLYLDFLFKDQWGIAAFQMKTKKNKFTKF